MTKSFTHHDSQTTVRVIADSIDVGGERITTLELTYPRFVHSELMTHRVFSRNAASSRAIPVPKMIDLVKENTAAPVHWGKNQSGMQANEELRGLRKWAAKKVWFGAARVACSFAKLLNKIGAHKQIVNRIIEPFQFIRVVVTATSYANFIHLRDHADAQPEIKVVGGLVATALDASVPQELEVGDWHVPYYGTGKWIPFDFRKTVDDDGQLVNTDTMTDSTGITLADALKISSSCAAQTSFRSLDASPERARRIYNRLVESEPVHASPFEHQATPIDNAPFPDTQGMSSVNVSFVPATWENGITHVDKEGKLWSGNFRGWIQHRQLIPNHVHNG